MANLHTTHNVTTNIRKTPKKTSDTIVADDRIKTLLFGIKETKMQIKKFQEEEKKYKNLLDSELDGAKIILDKEGFTLATWKNTHSHEFDVESFKKDHMNLYEEYLKEKIGRRLLIK